MSAKLHSLLMRRRKYEVGSINYALIDEAISIILSKLD